MNNVEVAVVALAAVLCLVPAATYSISNGVNYQGMEDNCILSFVVPRDKMKSSCNADNKAQRRMNAVEMKVNIYKQQMAELQLQLDKERLFNAERMDKMERQMRACTAHADKNVLVERRLALVEKEFTQLNAEIVMGRVKHHSHAHHEPQPYPFNAVDASPVTLPNLVKSMVQAEVKTMFDNLTRNFEIYVRDQILVYNQAFNILNRWEKTDGGEKTHGGKAAPRQTGRSQAPSEDDILRQFETVKAELDKSGDEIAKKVNSYLKEKVPPRKTNSSMEAKTVVEKLKPVNTTEEDEDVLALIASEFVLKDEELESNDSFSGENPDSNETVTEDSFTHRVDTKIGDGVHSRISANKDGSRADASESKPERWQENMVGDENYKQAKVERSLKEEISALLYDPLAKVMGMVKAEAAALNGKLVEQSDLNVKMTKDIKTRIHSLDQTVQSNSLQLQSLTTGFQDGFARLDKIATVEAAVNEIKTNLSADKQGVSAPELDQQKKKMKKMERLMNVYQQSLEHYKNETKHEYGEVKEKLKLETLSMKKIVKNLRNDVTSEVDKGIDQMKNLYSNQMDEIKNQVYNNEEKIVLAQIDIENHNRRLNNKNNRENRELDDVKSLLDQVISRNRDCRKKIENLQRKHSAVSNMVNNTAEAIKDLKKEVRLNLMDSWMKTKFDYDATISDCFGDQYVRKFKMANSNHKLVGVVLCSSDRYKILMGNSLQGMFYNIGDGRGLGEDHCEFVGAASEKNITLAPFKPTYRTIEGYARDTWGQVPKKAFINAFKPSPPWYQCGVSIP